ncbi:MAG: DUF4065 domain-containing protein [Planctomycetes bacterium]|nr:DUF4065 domain-containing protein [Planctomycetota bacterium]
MANIKKLDFLLLLLGLTPEGAEAEGIRGITRLQKLLFLLEEEENISPGEHGFEFTKYKAGPYSSKLYDDLEFLENLDLIRSESVAEATEEEAVEVEMLTFDDLVDDDEQETADAFEERRYALTDKGLRRVETLMTRNEYRPFVATIRKIKSKFGSYSLSDLIYYVYTKHPTWTTESEIKDRILRRRRRT